MWDIHVVKYMYFHAHIQLKLTTCMYECSQNHGYVKEFGVRLHLVYL